MVARTIVLIALLVFLSPNFVLGQVTSPHEPALTAAVPVQPAPEVAALRAQLEIIRNYQDRFIAIVQWALTTVVAVALGLAAFSWYTNKTSYERDRDSLRHERETLRQELRALVTEEGQQITKELKSSLSAQQGAVQASLEKAFDAKLEKITARIAKTNEKLLDVESDVVRREAEEAKNTKSYAWAIYKYSELLGLSVKRSADHYEVGETLDAMREILSIEGVSLSSDNVTTAVEALDRLPSRYQAAAARLIERVKQAHA